METESVRSELSSRSRRSSRHRQHTHRSTRSTKSQRKDCGDSIMAPFQTSVNINPETGRDGQEVIEVQILPQDENWGENTTAVTGNTSEGSQSMEDISNWAIETDKVRHLEPVYYIKIVRSPDGASRSYAIGELSIQRAAVWVLQKYYTEFPIYNPYLEKVPISKSQRKAQSSIKFYDVDGSNTNTASGQPRSAPGSCAGSGGRRRDSGSAHNERYYEEAERARRVRKRRARLLSAAEEAFAHVRRVRGAGGAALGPREAAQAVFPSLARALQKYLRATRQQPRHSADAVLAQLARSLAQDASPRAFLEPFLAEAPVLSAEREARALQRWALVSEAPPQAALRRAPDGAFQLRQGDVALLCSVRPLPRFALAEELVDPKSNRFVLRLNSETSV
ncbi:unnamed protein product, partial [Iphiclides podalirius]